MQAFVFGISTALPTLVSSTSGAKSLVMIIITTIRYSDYDAYYITIFGWLDDDYNDYYEMKRSNCSAVLT